MSEHFDIETFESEYGFSFSHEPFKDILIPFFKALESFDNQECNKKQFIINTVIPNIQLIGQHLFHIIDYLVAISKFICENPQSVIEFIQYIFNHELYELFILTGNMEDIEHFFYMCFIELEHNKLQFFANYGHTIHNSMTNKKDEIPSHYLPIFQTLYDRCDELRLNSGVTILLLFQHLEKNKPEFETSISVCKKMIESFNYVKLELNGEKPDLSHYILFPNEKNTAFLNKLKSVSNNNIDIKNEKEGL